MDKYLSITQKYYTTCLTNTINLNKQDNKISFCVDTKMLIMFQNNSKIIKHQNMTPEDS